MLVMMAQRRVNTLLDPRLGGWTFTKTRRLKKKVASVQMGLSKNNGTPKSSILTGFSIINHPFWGTTIFGNTQIYSWFRL